MQNTVFISCSKRYAFTLVEVVLALGIFLVTVLALIGLLGPTLKSVSDVENKDEVISVVNSVTAFLQNSPEFGDNKFQDIYNAVGSDQYATIFVFKAYQSANSEVIGLNIGFDGETEAKINSADFQNAAGQIYRVVLSASSILPDGLRSPARDPSTGIYTLTVGFNQYTEGYFVMEARVYAREQDMVAVGGQAMPQPTLVELNQETPIFTYDPAIVR